MLRRTVAAPVFILAIALSTLPGTAWSSPLRGVAGSWRAYSSTLYYNIGGGGSFPASPRLLTISGNRWRWGPSTGKVALKRIVASDWKRWRVHPYGPTMKIVWHNWNHHTASGPVETNHGRIVFLWVVYRVRPPVVKAPGIVYLKFGRAHP